MPLREEDIAPIEIDLDDDDIRLLDNVLKFALDGRSISESAYKRAVQALTRVSVRFPRPSPPSSFFQAQKKDEELPGEGKHRVQLDFAPKAYVRLTKIVEDGEFASKADAIRTSLAVLEWYLLVKSKGGRTLAQYEDGTVESVELIR